MFLSLFVTDILYAFLFSPMCVSCLTQSFFVIWSHP
jgi:hypothetical protein